VSETLEVRWVRVYGKKWAAFVGGKARGDYYETDTGVWRARVWPRDRLVGGRECLVLDEELAKQMVLEMLGRARDEEQNG